MCELNLDLLGGNTRPFAEYLDAETADIILAGRRFSQKRFKTAFPKTLALSERMFGRMRRRELYGVQFTDGRWITVFAERPTRQAHPLNLNDVRGVLLGYRNVRAIATTDRAFSHGTTTFLPPPIRTLRFDVDFKPGRGWADLNIEEGMREIRREVGLCSNLGLNGEVFRTGGKGHQLVMALPCEVDLSVASMLSWMYKQIHELSAPNAPKVDKTNLDSNLREPGGRHVNGGELALFVDVESDCFHSIEKQAELFVRAFECHPGSWGAEDFQEHQRALSDELRYNGTSPHAVITSSVASAVFADSSNPLVTQYREIVRDYLTVPFLAPSTANSRNKSVATDGSEPASDTTNMSKTRATSVFHMDVHAKGFFDWFHPSGHNGIGAAYCLFGVNGLRELLLKAERTPHLSPRDLTDRKRDVTNFWRTYQPPIEVIQNDVEAIRGCWQEASARVRQLRSLNPKARWKLDPVTAFLAVIMGKAKSENREKVRIGHRYIHRAAKEAFPELSFSTRTILRARHILVEGNLLISGVLVDASSEPDYYCLPSSKLDLTEIQGRLSSNRKLQIPPHYRGVRQSERRRHKNTAPLLKR